MDHDSTTVGTDSEASTGPCGAPAPLPAGEGRGQHLGAYELLEVLGEGGFGVVWLAERREPMVQRVALKVIKAGMDSAAVVARFEQERQALAVMDHPNVAKVFDGGTTPSGRPYFVMEHVEGKTLTAYADHERLSVRRRLELFIPVCEAVQHAHQKGVIHRDLKPGNILVTTVNGMPVPKVIDFGIAKALGTNPLLTGLTTAGGQVIGTPEYMSPEQAAGSLDVDTRTDVYALGVVLYELLVGVRPFEAATLRHAALEEMLRVIREDSPARPSTRLHALGQTGRTVAEARDATLEGLTRQLRRELEWVPLKALRKEREARYGSPGALAQDIRRYLAGHALEAGPESAVYRARKFVRRHRVPVIACASITLSLAAGIVGTAIGLVGERRQRERADERAREARWREYVAGVGAADAALRADEPGAASAWLSAAPEECRGWEWRHFRAAAERSLLIVRSDAAFLNDPCLSDDGEFLLARAAFDSVRVWDARSGRPVRTITPETGRLKASGFHAGLRLVAVASTDLTLSVWSLDEEKPRRVVTGLDAGPSLLVFSPDGTRLAWGTEAQTAHVLHLESGSDTALRGHEHGASAIAFSTDGTRLAIGCGSGAVRLWDLRSGGTVVDLPSQDSGIHSIAFSPDGARLCTTGENGKARIHDAGTGALVHSLRGHDQRSTSCAFSRDGELLATASQDRTVRVWETGTGRFVTVLRHPASVERVLFSRDDDRLFSACSDGIVRAWDARAGVEVAALRGHGHSVTGLTAGRDGARLVSTGWRNDASLRVWDARTRPDVIKFKVPGGAAEALAFSADGETLAVGSWEGHVSLWDCPSGTCLATLEGHGDRVWGLAYNDAGSRIVTASWDGTAQVWDAHCGESVLRLGDGSVPLRGAAFVPGTGAIVTSGGDSASVWDARTGERLTALTLRDQPVTPPCVHPTLPRLGVAGFRGTVGVYDLDSGAPVFPERMHGGRVYRLVFDAGGHRFATGGDDDTVRIWGSTDGIEVAAIPSPDGPPFGIAWSPDGSRLAVGAGRTVHLWDTATWTDVATLRGHSGSVRCAAFSRDGRRLATSDDDGLVLVHDSAPETQRCRERDDVASARIAAEGMCEQALTRRDARGAAEWLRAADAGPVRDGALRALLARTMQGAERLEHAVEQAAEAYGESHWQTRRKRMQLAERYRADGNYDRAIAVVARALADARAEKAKPSEVQWTIAVMAWMHDLKGDLSKAAELYRESAELSAHALGENDDATVLRYEQLAHVLARLGEFKIAEKHLVRVVEERTRRLGPAAEETVRARDLLDWCRLRAADGSAPSGAAPDR